VDVGQNTRLTVSEGVNLSQNVRIDYSNTALTIAQGVDNSQNVRLDFSNTAINQTLSSWTVNTIIVANSTGYLSNSNSFYTSSNNTTIINGQMTARGNVTVNGDIIVANTLTSNTARIEFNAALNTLDFIIG
jgi:hypothetical protein